MNVSNILNQFLSLKMSVWLELDTSLLEIVKTISKLLT